MSAIRIDLDHKIIEDVLVQSPDAGFNRCILVVSAKRKKHRDVDPFPIGCPFFLKIAGGARATMITQTTARA